MVFQKAIVRVIEVVDRAKEMAWNWFAVRIKGAEVYGWANWCTKPLYCLVNQ